MNTSLNIQSRITSPRTAWIRTAQSIKPKYLITLTLKQPRQYKTKGGRDSAHNSIEYKTSTPKALDKFNLLIHFVNCYLFGKQYEKNNNYLHGVGSLEYQKNGQPHIHLLVDNDVDYYDLDAAIFFKSSKFPMMDCSGIDVQRVTDSEQDILDVSKYVMKCMETDFNNGLPIVLGQYGIMD